MLDTANESDVKTSSTDITTVTIPAETIIPEIKLDAPEIKAEPADSILRASARDNIEPAPTRARVPLFRRLLSFGRRVAIAACLCGVAWAGASFYSSHRSLFAALQPMPAGTVQQSSESDDMVRSMQQMADEIHALDTRVEAIAAAQGTGVKDAETNESLKTQLDTVQTTTSASMADLAGRVDRAEADSTTKLAQLGARLDGIEHRIAAIRTTPASTGPLPRKRIQHPHDAFDPSQNPTAPGAPRSLGTVMNARPSGQNAY